MKVSFSFSWMTWTLQDLSFLPVSQHLQTTFWNSVLWSAPPSPDFAFKVRWQHSRRSVLQPVVGLCCHYLFYYHISLLHFSQFPAKNISNSLQWFFFFLSQAFLWEYGLRERPRRYKASKKVILSFIGCWKSTDCQVYFILFYFWKISLCNWMHS